MRRHVIRAIDRRPGLRPTPYRDPGLHNLCTAPAARPSADRARLALGAAVDHQPGTGQARARHPAVVQRPRGDRLRAWLAIDRETFYDEARVAILGMAFCYPGRDNKGGDLPPRPECAPRWHTPLRAFLPAIGLTLLVGSYAIDYYLPRAGTRSMTETIARWRDFLPEFLVLPHPSWRATRGLRANPWFETEVLPELRARVNDVLSPPPRSAPCPRR